MLLRRTMHDALLNQVGVDADFLLGDGLENFYVEQEDGTMAPLFPDYAELKKEAEKEPDYPYHTEMVVGQRILEALRENPLYVYGPNIEDPEKTRAAELRLRKNGQLRTYVVSEKDPVKPAWYKRLLNSINKNWYKGEVEQYQREKAVHDEAVRQKENAEEARARLLNGEAPAGPRQQALREKNAAAVKPRSFESAMAQIKKNCLSNLSRAAASDVTVDHLTDTFSLMMYTRELENVAKNGTPAAREMLYQMSPEKLMGIYQNVYLKSPDVQESINRFQLLGAEGGHTITDHLGLGMCDAIEELGPDLKKYEPEDLALANVTADYLVQQKKNLAK